MHASRAFVSGIVLGVLTLTGWATNRWMEPTWREIRAAEPALHVQSLQGALGKGIMFGLLGGFRAITADFLWLEMNSHWEAEDLVATHKLIDLVTTIDPRPLYFWINGARMIAYDMPYWRLRVIGGGGDVPLAVQQRVDSEQAWAGIALLERGRETHPLDPRLVLEIAGIHLRRRNDVATAAEYYRLAATMPAAPYYAARIYAELLKRMGRLRDAYTWLRALHPTLPADDPLANADVVFQRLRELETALDLPANERYVASPP